MVGGTLGVGPVEFVFPGSEVVGCAPGLTTFDGTIDDVANTATAALVMSQNFGNYLTGNNILDVVGVGTTGTFSPGPDTVAVNVNMVWTIRAFAGPPSCAPGVTKCGGTATMQVVAEFPSFPTSPLTPVHLSSTGTIVTTSTPPCPGFLGVIFRPTAFFGLSAHPFSSLPGAEFV